VLHFIFELASYMDNHQNHKKKDCCDVKSDSSIDMHLHTEHLHTEHEDAPVTYKPLIIILAFCILLPIVQLESFQEERFMYDFMGYFFVFLSLFKFFDLKGFIEGFSTYDLITKQLRAYGYLYPFIELCLGLAYLANFHLFVVNLITLIVMIISGLGVLKSVLSGQKIKCVCLGTSLNVPLSTVSILENFGMAAMATYQLIFFL